MQYDNNDFEVITWDMLEPIPELQDAYEPEYEQLIEYGHHIGLNLPSENHYLYLAREGLIDNLPADWEVCKTKNQQIFYRNCKTRQIREQNPIDNIYREKVKHIRKVKSYYEGQQIKEESMLNQSSGIHQSLKKSKFKKDIQKNRSALKQQIVQTQQSCYQDEIESNVSKKGKKAQDSFQNWQTRHLQRLQLIKIKVKNYQPQEQQLITNVNFRKNLNNGLQKQTLRLTVLQQKIKQRERQLEKLTKERRQSEKAFLSLDPHNYY